MNTRAQRITEAIMKSGYSYTELSKMTGISKSSLQRYATGETKKIPIDCIEKIALATNSDSKWLMGWDDAEEVNNNDIPLPPVNDPDIRRIERARSNMPEEDRERMMTIIEMAFPHYFSDDFIDEDTDE